MVRIMIILLLAGSAFLGWRANEQQTVIDRYEAALTEDGEVEQRVRSILKSAYLYTAYKDRKLKEGVKSGDTDSVGTYVREIAQGRSVMWGAVKVGKPQERTRLTGYDDTWYKITPQESKAYFGQAQIANFLYLLEFNSRKLKVTNVDIRVAEKSLKPHEVPEKDKWAVSVNVTMRERSKKK